MPWRWNWVVPWCLRVGVKSDGACRLCEFLDDPHAWRHGPRYPTADSAAERIVATQTDHEAVHEILKRLGLAAVVPHTASDRIDRVVLHPVFGPILLAALLFLVFQAVFSWAQAPMDAVKSATDAIGAAASSSG